MDEDTVVQEGTQTSDPFLDGWEEPSVISDPADQPEEDTEETWTQPDGETTQEEPLQEGGEEPAEEEATKEQAQSEDAQEQPPEQDTVPSWNVKHMGEERSLSVKDITPELLQKGLDYDRVRDKYDEAKPMLEMFGQFAQKANMTVPEYLRYIRAETMRAQGMSEEEAKRTVELEDREAAVAAKETQAQAETQVQEEAQRKRESDIANFSKAFPDVFEKAREDPKVIPQSVWDDVGNGMSLTAAYSKYAVAQAEAQARAAKEQAETAGKNRANAQRATGSMCSAGGDVKSADPFLDGFES